MTGPSFPLTTARLRLRPFEEGDFEAVYAMESHPDVVRYLYWEPRTRDEARAALDRRIRLTSLDGDPSALRLAVILRDSGEVIGDFSLGVRSRRNRQGDIGFMFHPDHHGHGYATEAGRLVLGLGFDTYDLHRIAGSCDARNTASARLMERLGMRLEARLRETEFVKGTWCDERVYAILADEWRDRVRAPAMASQ
ncbi:MAG: GNAT family N-acetyltransferase [Chloroflexi bacterium]|nr:GNAT family N-acetyltransferase [Chloroflexota bacterium]